jgi:uncharacterized membrane protein
VKRAAVVAALALLGGCATLVPRGRNGAATCDAGSAHSFIGNAAGTQTAEQARVAARAKTVRMLTPGTIVTMEYRADRLNLTIDESGHIAKAHCG